MSVAKQKTGQRSSASRATLNPPGSVAEDGAPVGVGSRDDRLVPITPRSVARVLACVVLALTVLSALGQLARHLLPDFVLRDRFAATFDVDTEGNVPSLYSTLALLLCAVLLAVIARRERAGGGRRVAHWAALSLIFVGLAADEYLALHEEINSRLRLPRITVHSWVFVGAACVVLFVIAYVPFIISLSSRMRRLFLASGALYISGVLGLELLGGHFVSRWGHQSPWYLLETGAEEFLEMAAIVLFVYTLLTYLTGSGGEVSLGWRLRPDAAPARRTDAPLTVDSVERGS